MRALGATLALIVGMTAAQGTELVLLAPGNAKDAISDLMPKVEVATGHKVRVVYASPVLMKQKVEAGEPFDVLIGNGPSVKSFQQGGGLAQLKVFAKVYAMMAYRKGSQKPDVTTLDGFRRTIESARSISHSDFKLGGGSAAYYATLTKSLGLDDQVEAKAVITDSGQGAVPVNDGRAEIGIAQSNEVRSLANVEATRLLPADDRGVSTFEIALSMHTKEAVAAQALLDALTSETAGQSLQRFGYFRN